MKGHPLRTTVIGSYPFPGWLEFAAAHLERFGPADLAEMQKDAVIAAVHDQLAAGLDVITDGEQTRLDFNLSFYGYLEGIDLEAAPERRFGPPAHDQRGKHRLTGELKAPRGLGVVAEYQRLLDAAPPGPVLKVSIPGPYTLSGRIQPGGPYKDRWAVTEALLPIVRKELEAIVAAGCREITVDEPSMSCYAYREDPFRFVGIFERTVESVRGKCRLSTHLCFGNYKARAVGPRRYAPMFPAFFNLPVDEIHLEMASREFAEIGMIAEIAKRCDVAVGIVDVKSYYIEPPEEIAARVRLCLKHAPADRLSFAPDCGLSQTARWAAFAKLRNMVEGVRLVRLEQGV
ncbi:MAG: cobalamin-independent methionine synthase II family protein [Bryobacteraceae bacterium]|nr:cobalamin-independent methionine synthase II family protein [Bryobacterales bacterium]MEB2361547.1 cobalamin-independent methionine synthase II family protein [Bryobacterales bacterium]NUN02045.1 cobalamin-independent methionine synthase II family protein [Bryobacteraceae bacterium]